MRSGGEATSKVSQMSEPLVNSNSSAAAKNAGIQQFNERKTVSDLSRRCDRCLEVVSAGGTQLPNGLLFHDQCFTCDECGRLITGKFVSENRKCYHPECRIVVATSNKGLICKKCNKAITGKFIKVCCLLQLSLIISKK